MRDQLVERLEEAIAFAAHVRDVAAAGFAGRAAPARSARRVFA